MFNPEHLGKLCEGPKAWNAWRNANPNIVPELSNIRLTLHQRQLGPSNGGPVDLHTANLELASLPYATLTGADLANARLVGADLTNARLDRAKLNGANLTDAILDQADLMGAALDQAVLFGADLSNTRNLTVAQLVLAYGDASTRLPGNIAPPQSWFPTADYDDDYSGWSIEAPGEENLYEILGLTLGAGSEEIRTAYRNLVKKLHPDINPNDEEAQERFKRVSAAYRVLNDSAQRQRYDRGEIDGEGRVSAEFEARQRFRRTAFRYCRAAVGFFLLTAGALAGMWWTVLSTEPWDKAVQVVVSQPKTGGRLGEAAAPAMPAKAETRTAISGHGSVQAEPEGRLATLSADAAQPFPPIVTPIPTTAPDVATPAPSGDNRREQETETGTEQLPAPKPVATVASSLPLDPATDPSAVAPGYGTTAPPTATNEAARGSPSADATGHPFQKRYRNTTPSAPDRASVAVLPQGGLERKPSPGPDSRFIGAAKQRPWQSWQELTARDLASQVLRDRAIAQSRGKKSHPIMASNSDEISEHRAGLSQDSPNNALPSDRGPPRSAALRRAAPTQQHKSQLGARMTVAPQARSASMTADKAAQRQAHQQEVVSDVLAGGF